ncbi:hypothetical protein PoB_005906400 [Plakobranchus ocellatus]|uniref:Uncharacterized protein n=1 Tax=Plakobranchus ocellatus TaxID=259542 RepID=A0AAV4CME5_9GAST|nr:hypothetical protein PoB_005906400 [Plakobranchus ocellatus]
MKTVIMTKRKSEGRLMEGERTGGETERRGGGGIRKDGKEGVHNTVISDFGPSVRPRHRWWGSNPRQEGPSRSQGGLASHCATDAPQPNERGVGGTVASESALRSAGTLLSRVRAPPRRPGLTEGLKA